MRKHLKRNLVFLWLFCFLLVMSKAEFTLDGAHCIVRCFLSLGASFVGVVASSLFALMAVCQDMELKLEIKGPYCFKDHRQELSWMG